MMKNASMAGDDGVVDERWSPCRLNVESESNGVLIYARHSKTEKVSGFGTRGSRDTHLHLNNSERNMSALRPDNGPYRERSAYLYETCGSDKLHATKFKQKR